MTRRRIAAAFISVAALLFGGRWIAGLVARRAWAADFGPAAEQWVTELAVLTLLLDVAGAVFAALWFALNLVVVVRGIERVQLSRAVPDGEIRESVRPATLLNAALGTGVVLGLLSGGDLSTRWPDVALAWEGVRTGLAEPLLGQDAGVYLAQLPLWRFVHELLWLLGLTALLMVTLLYLAIGAIRWIDSRPAITDHARRHLGWLTAILALVLATGYLIEPLEWIASGPESVARGSFALVELGAPVLTGFAIATALLSLLWAFKGRHAVFLAGWFLLLGASAVLHYVLPSFRRGSGEGTARDAVLARALNAEPAALGTLQDTVTVGAADEAPPRFSLWGPRAATNAVLTDSLARALAADPAPLDHDGGAPGWLVMRDVRGGRAEVVALRDDRTLPDGGAAPAAGGELRARLELDAVRPGAAPLVIGREAHGPALGGMGQRVLLAWALQAPDLLRRQDAGARGAWLLDPRQRLAALLPFAEWGDPVLRAVDGRIMWLVPGYLIGRAYPLAEPVPWRDGTVPYVRAAFLAAIDAETGRPRIALRDDAGPLGDAWARIVGPLIEPPGALPAALRRAEPYPAALLAAQARMLERRDASLGRLQAAGSDGHLLEQVWRPELESPSRVALFESAERRELTAVLEGQTLNGRPRLLLRRFASEAMPGLSVLPGRWARMPSFTQLRDSVRAAQGEFEESPVRLAFDGPRPMALQAWYARREARTPPQLAWVSVAAGERLGAGRSFVEAWENLRGRTVPGVPGAGRGSLEDARRWVRAADEALRRGDLAGFARAFEALRQSVERAPR